MKKMMLTLIAVFAIAISSNAMSYEQARNEALFLTDKMAYELNLTDAQYEAAYEINLDYLMSVSSRHDVFGPYWDRRNLDLQYILYSWQWEALRAASYFYRPLYWDAGYWHFGVYARYPHRNYFYFGRPHFYATYRGGHSWRLNGGHSYYEHHRHHYSPSIAREHHSGMRDGWNRGNYRTQHGHNSSTRITGHDGRPDHGNHSGMNGRPSGSNHDNNSGVNGRPSGGNHDNNSGVSNRPSGGNHDSNSGVSNRPSGTISSRPAGNSMSDRTTRSLSSRPSGSISNRPAGSISNRSAGNSMSERPTRSMSTPQRSGAVSTPQRSSAPSSSRGSFSAPQRSSGSSAGSHSSSGGSRGGNGGGRSGGRR